MPKSQKDFQAEMDANTLAEASAIRADKQRMQAAKRKATILAKEQQIKASALKRVSTTRITKKKGRKK